MPVSNAADLVDSFRSVKRFGAVGDGVADDTTAIQAAIDSLSWGIIYFPRGVYKITNALNIDVSSKHISLIGESWASTFIANSTAGVAALNFTGTATVVGGQNYASNGGWFEVRDLSIGSSFGHAMRVHQAGLNGRLRDIWFYSCAVASNWLHLDQSGMPVGEMTHLRFGTGNMGNTDEPAAMAIVRTALGGATTNGVSFIQATSDTGYFTAELHFSHIQGHDGFSGDGIVINKNGGAASLFNVTFDTCEIKPGQTNATGAAYNLKNCGVSMINCFSEATGTSADMVKISGGATVRMTNCNANNCSLTADLSIAGANKFILVGTHARTVRTSGATGSIIVMADQCSVDVAPTGFTSGTTWLGEENYLLSGGSYTPLNFTHSWTPGCTIGGGSYTLTASEGTYSKRGRMVHYNCRLEFQNPINLGGLTGDVVVTGLPFTADNSPAIDATWLATGKPTAMAAGIAQIIGQVNSNATTILVQKVAAGTTSTVQHTDLANGCQIRLSGSYMTES